MLTSYTSTRTYANDGKGAMKRSGGIPRLCDEDIRVAISHREESLDKTEYGANVGVVILLIAVVIAFVTLFFHVANK